MLGIKRIALPSYTLSALVIDQSGRRWGKRKACIEQYLSLLKTALQELREKLAAFLRDWIEPSTLPTLHDRVLSSTYPVNSKPLCFSFCIMSYLMVILNLLVYILYLSRVSISILRLTVIVNNKNVWSLIREVPFYYWWVIDAHGLEYACVIGWSIIVIVFKIFE